jgi:dTDP-4-dehydrorhamnose reductase
MKYPKILLIGGSGQIGFALKKELKILGKIESPNRHEFDLTNFELFRKKIQILKPNLIINAAAYTEVDLAETNPELAYKINAEAPKVLAEESLKLDIPLIHFSTDYVFDGRKKKTYSEEDIPNPINIYGKSKLEGEQAIQKIYNKFIIIRTSWVYDPNRGKNFYRTIKKLFQEKNEIRVVNDQYGCPTSARFLAKKITKVLNQLNLNPADEKRWGIYHLTEDIKMTWFDFAKKIFILEKSLINKKDFNIIPVRTIDYSTVAKRPLNSVLDLEKIKSAFVL